MSYPHRTQTPRAIAIRSNAADARRRDLRLLAILAGLAATAALPRLAHGQSLKGSKESVEKMYSFAVSHGLPFMQTPEQVDAAASAGRLVPLTGNGYYETSGGVGWSYVLPETKRFVEAFAPLYADACNAPLIVTSAARPIDRQPRNANPHSVHPTGMAIDLRRPPKGPCLDWVRGALSQLEARGLIEATEEYHPVHLHVAILTPPGEQRTVPAITLANWHKPSYPVPYSAIMAANTQQSSGTTATTMVASTPAAAVAAPALRTNRPGPWSAAVDKSRTALPTPARWVGNDHALAIGNLTPVSAVRAESVSAGGEVALDRRPDSAATTVATTASTGRVTAAQLDSARGRTYTVRPGDTLWDVSRRLKLPMSALAAENHLGPRATLKPGVVLKIPGDVATK